MPKPRTVTFVFRTLLKHDDRFEIHERRGKGSHRVIFHPDVGGRPESFPVKYHGKKTELRRGVLSGIIRRFQLPRDIFG